MLELKQLTPPAAESVTTRSVPSLVTRQADSLEGGHGSGGVRQRLPNTQSELIGKTATAAAGQCGFESRLSASKPAKSPPIRVEP